MFVPGRACVWRRSWSSAALLAVLCAACAGEGEPRVEPSIIAGNEWSTPLRIVGLEPSAYMVMGPEGLSAAEDLAIELGGVPAQPLRITADAIVVRLSAPLAAGEHELSVLARGRMRVRPHALTVVAAELRDGGSADASIEALDAALPDGALRDGATGDAGLASEDGAVPPDAAPLEAGPDAGSADGGRTELDGGAPDATVASDASLVRDAGWDPASATEVSAGSEHTCAIVSGSLYCWGHNTNGQLGQGSTTPSSSSTPLRVPLRRPASRVSAGGRHTCAIDDTGALYCWGFNSSGQLGVLLGLDPLSPNRVGLGRYTDVSAGAEHTCAVASDGSAWCWGNGTDGRLGDGSGLSSRVPVRARVGSSVSRVSAGDRHSCALADDGALYCWGHGARGQLGDGAEVSRDTPVRVGSGAWSWVSAGAEHTCAVDARGGGYCWGDGNRGEIGDGATRDAPRPSLVAGFHTWRTVSAGDEHSCGVTVAGDLYCWGRGSQGRLGNGATVDVSVPSSAMPGTDWSAVESGADHTVALRTRGGAGVYCAGRGTDGRVGTSGADLLVFTAMGGL